MGVDSGLPDFRGKAGFWEAYPPFADLGVDFFQMANPAAFESDPTLAWGFYGHRYQLYRDTTPHPGFGILLEWARAMKKGAFVFTSNIDGHFQRAGFPEEQVVECHGSLNYLQCTRPCSDAIWSAEGMELDVDMSQVRALGPLPTCLHCGALARPNVLMFGDWHWVGDRSSLQESLFSHWCQAGDFDSLVIVECGAGTTVPTVRSTCENVAQRLGGTLVRINPRDPQVPRGHRSLASGALDALEELEEELERL
jgi:NAD-dependent SIR2 family protein deacetylase